MTTSTRAERAEQTRQLIQETAHRLFTDHGYDATSLQMIADEIGVTKAAVYYHYRTKSEILTAIAEGPLSVYNDLLDEVERQPNRRLRVQTFVEGYADIIVNHRRTAPVKNSDPGIRRELEKNGTLNQLLERGLLVLFGDAPADEDRAAFYLMPALSDVMVLFAELSDDDLRAIVRQLSLRLLRVRT